MIRELYVDIVVKDDLEEIVIVVLWIVLLFKSGLKVCVDMVKLYFFVEKVEDMIVFDVGSNYVYDRLIVLFK